MDSRAHSEDQNQDIVLCTTDDLADVDVIRVEPEGFPVMAVYRVDEEYYATDDQCSHGRGFLSEGTISNGEIECPFHRGRFDIRTGEPTERPCTVPVTVYAVTVVDGKIILKAS